MRTAARPALFLLLVAAAGAYAGASVDGGFAQALGPPGDAQDDGAPVALAAVPSSVSEPVLLDVPAIGVHATVRPVGLRPDGAAQTPPPAQAGWWRLGALPGETGSAVLLGHRDTRSGPAVFAALPELTPGHLIGVHTADGPVVVFAVRAVTRHDKDALPAALWRSDGGARILRLITCGGQFDPGRRSYTDNVVVHAEVIGAWREGQAPAGALPAAHVRDLAR